MLLTLGHGPRIAVRDQITEEFHGLFRLLFAAVDPERNRLPAVLRKETRLRPARGRKADAQARLFVYIVE